ncbi:putative erythromycin esterase [Phaeomoniella chlamydospora]|uniref:Putative erythromycin esterase n=1 Tax=Phaeomoniella chlamydospora TaxID=158046 RepID=A0A0G2GCM3_PHACM|nr:putative erythromycin esterase [Phaeomoniella chlamydospora]
MATPRRRSARLRKSATPERSAGKKSAVPERLGALLERDETPESGAAAQPSLDTILSTPNGPPNTELQDRFAQLSALKTPSTVPRPSHAEMHPEDAHKSTTKAPDSGLRLGFSDISDKCIKSISEAQNTPTKRQSSCSVPSHLTSPGFEFKFASDSSLSREAQRMMDNVREEAARIKAEMRQERDEQDSKDAGGAESLRTYNLAGRKIARPRGKAGRFSDVHMTEFKKMDSIADHPSAFRARAGYLKPTGQSLKRSSAKAALDDLERPRTAGRLMSPVKLSTTLRRNASKSPSKAVRQPANNESSFSSPAKRVRTLKTNDTSPRLGVQKSLGDLSRSASQSRHGFGFSSNLLTPTKASLARTGSVKEPNTAPSKTSMLPKSASTKSLKSSALENKSSSTDLVVSNSITDEPAELQFTSPAPVRKSKPSSSPDQLTTSKPLPPPPSSGASTSKLPKFSGLKSILRRHQPLFSNDPIKIAAGTHVASPSGASKINSHLSNLSSDGIGTPDRRMTMGIVTPSAKKRVNFTSSTKDRYELALASPSPTKIPLAGSQKRPGTPYAPMDMFNSAAYTLNEEVHYPQLNIEASSEPSSPPGEPTNPPVKHISQQHVLSRDSPHFRSIFTTLQPRPSTADSAVTTTTTTTTRRSRSPSSSPFKPSPSTIRRVRQSGVNAAAAVQPFEDMPTVPHGLPGKKRRRESADELDTNGDAKSNSKDRRISVMPEIPGGFPADSPRSSSIFEAPNAKRRKTQIFNHSNAQNVADVDPAAMKENAPDPTIQKVTTSPIKKVARPSTARAGAAHAAKERKTGATSAGGSTPGKGFLTMSRLNMLSRPKERR